MASAHASAIALFRFVSGDKKVVPNHIGGGLGQGGEGEADGAGEHDGSDPDNLLTITVKVQP